MGRLDLASTISILASMVRKKADFLYRGASCATPTAAAAVPKPNQPGSITRAWDQENTQGIARKSSIFGDLVREAGRLPILRSAISKSGVAWRKYVSKPV